MISVGITGGIGSGKTTVSKIFELLKVPVYYADDRAKHLMATDEELKAQLKATFGEATYDEQGNLNRPYLADKVFNNESELQKLNSLVHPAVFKDTATWFQANSDAAYVLYESAILLTSGSAKMLNKIITVHAPEEMRIERVLQRDNTDEEHVRARMKNQLSESEMLEKADYVIYNDNSQSVISQILKLHKELNNQSNG